jgi:hypothetical protein
VRAVGEAATPYRPNDAQTKLGSFQTFPAGATSAPGASFYSASTLTPPPSALP